MYEIKYGPLDMYINYCGLMVEGVNTTGPVLMMNLTGLEKYVEYNVTVRAYTSEGPGPYSGPPFIERTLEDGIRVDFHVSATYTHHIYPTVPAEPPRNVSATALSSTEIEVSWEEVHYCDQNGVIIMYEIGYEPLDCGLTVESVVTTGPVLMVNLTGLEKYVEYNVTVRVYTSEGPGPYSAPPITERTLEDGMKYFYTVVYSDQTLHVL